MLFFKDFPRTAYIFGDQETTGGQQVTYEIFQDISRYTDILDQIKDNVSFYQNYTIQENDRPDQVSFKLYGSPEYHWTFFLMNEKLRNQGWPLTMRQLDEVAKRDFPHYTITTRDDLTSIFLVGQTAIGSVSAAKGEILRRYLDLGQVVVDSQKAFLAGEAVRNVAPTADGTGSIDVQSISKEYLAAHHYEDVNGNWVDIDPAQGPGAQLVEVTHYDRYVKENNQLKNIRIIKPELMQEVVSAFTQAIKS
jgi:hypothetical protein